MQELNQAIIDIYSSPGSQQLLDTAIESISRFCNSDYEAYMLTNLETMEVEFSSNPKYPDWMVEQYHEVAVEKDVRLKYAHNVKPGGVYRDFEYIPDMQEYARSEWIQYQYRELGIYYNMVAYVSTHGLWGDYLSLTRMKSRGRFTDKEKSRFKSVLPHLSKAPELNRWVTDLEQRYRAVLSVLDKLMVGLIILDKRGSVVVANEKARSLSDISGTYSFVRSGQLKIFDEEKQTAFKQMISMTADTASGQANCDGGQIVLKNRSSEQDILLEIMPIRDDGFSDSDKISGAAVFILEPSCAQLISTEGLSKIFDLTRSESQITRALVNGMDVKRIARERDTSEQTVRSQVKQVFGKTGAHSQLDLLRLAVKLCPPINAGTSDENTPTLNKKLR